MSALSHVIGAGALAIMLATPALAQYPSQYPTTTPPANRGFFVAVDAGGLSPARNLNATGTADFKTGFTAGGTVGVWMQKYVGLRANLTYGRNALRTGGFATGVDLNKFFYGGALQLQYPMASGVTPYAFVGGGGITLDPSGSVAASRTTGAGLVGAGVTFPIPNSNFGVLGQASGLYYKLADMNGPLAGYDHNQFDVTYSLGLSYRLPF